jgi:N6-L-threonylcarbamoyladenine synthase
MTIILGIESTCDETAAALIKKHESGFVEILSHIISSQQKEHEEYGGVVPELAARSHLDNIDIVIKNLFKQSENIKPKNIDAIAASSNPGLIGGLIVGNLFAKTMALALNKKFIAIDHLEAHILMPLMNNSEIQYPFIALLISGGNTKIILVHDFENYQLLSETIDDSLGETFDKVALMLGLKYPGGPLIEKNASKGDSKKFLMPMPLCNGTEKENLNFSFSGLKTHIKLLIEKNQPINENFIYDLCASFQKTITDILIKKLENSLKKCNIEIKDIVISGGVSANLYIKNLLIKNFHNYRLHFPSRELCTDNGVMIAWNGLLKYEKGFFETLDSKISPYSNLGNLNV